MYYPFPPTFREFIAQADSKFQSADGVIGIYNTVELKETAITAAAVTKTYNVAKNLVITLKDDNGDNLANKTVNVTINGKTYQATTKDNGQASIALTNLAPKTYPTTINFAGDDTYKASNSTVKVVVKKATPKLTAKAKAFKVKTKTKKYTITLKTNKGKVLKKAKVTLKVKGKTYKATTNAKGQATFKITKLTKTGKFTATVKFAKTSYYNQVTKKVKITVKK